MGRFLSLIALASVAACGDGGGASNKSYRVEAMNGQCVISTGRSAGDTCSAPDECAMGCCSCAGSSKRFSASACVDGVCQALADACATAKPSAPCD